LAKSGRAKKWQEKEKKNKPDCYLPHFHNALHVGFGGCRIGAAETIIQPIG
jgi:hypothetical protein